MNDSTSPVIQITHLTKTYRVGWFSGQIKAVDDLSLTVHKGEIFGYLGPNGAGKTTTIRMMLNLIRPTSGQCKIFGLDSQHNEVEIKAHIGNLPSELRLWDNMTGRQVLQYLAQLRAGCDLDYAFALAERLNLNLDKEIRRYSTGNKRKIGVVQAVMHKPDLVILDEPTTGLDPLVQRTFSELLMEIRSEGRTVFLSSHVLSEVQEVCDRVAVLRRGRLQAVETISRLTEARWVTVYTSDQIEGLDQIPHVQGLTVLPRGYRVCIQGSIAPLLRELAKYEVDDLKTEDVNLEDIFADFYKEST